MLWTELPPIHIPQACFDSQKRALERFEFAAIGLPHKFTSGELVRIGEKVFDGEEFFLLQVAAKGTADIHDLQGYLNSIWKSEASLNSFLKRLGRALSDSTNRRTHAPDWFNQTNMPLNLVVAGWCERIIVKGVEWPPLCCLTFSALANFIKLCKSCGFVNDERTLEQSIRRLGLKRIPSGRIKEVVNKFGEFRFR